MTKIQRQVAELNKLFLAVQAYKASHPDERIGYYEYNIGSILNAYREGDLGFDETIAAIEKAFTAKAIV